jgi:hypothetical protein
VQEDKRVSDPRVFPVEGKCLELLVHGRILDDP